MASHHLTKPMPIPQKDPEAIEAEAEEDRELIERTRDLARRMHGYLTSSPVTERYDEKSWNLACIAQLELMDADPESALERAHDAARESICPSAARKAALCAA